MTNRLGVSSVPFNPLFIISIKSIAKHAFLSSYKNYINYNLILKFSQPRGKKKASPYQNEDCETLCLKFQLLGWMARQPNPDTGLFILWACISYHLLGTTCQFVNSKGLKLVKICGLLPAPTSTDSGQNGKMHRAARLSMTHMPINSNRARRV